MLSRVWNPHPLASHFRQASLPALHPKRVASHLQRSRIHNLSVACLCSASVLLAVIITTHAPFSSHASILCPPATCLSTAEAGLANVRVAIDFVTYTTRYEVWKTFASSQWASLSQSSSEAQLVLNWVFLSTASEHVTVGKRRMRRRPNHRILSRHQRPLSRNIFDTESVGSFALARRWVIAAR